MFGSSGSYRSTNVEPLLDLLKHNYREWKSGRLSQEVRIREKKRGYVVLHFLYSSIFFSLFSSKMHVYMHACVHNRGLWHVTRWRCSGNTHVWILPAFPQMQPSYSISWVWRQRAQRVHNLHLSPWLTVWRAGLAQPFWIQPELVQKFHCFVFFLNLALLCKRAPVNCPQWNTLPGLLCLHVMNPKSFRFKKRTDWKDWKDLKRHLMVLNRIFDYFWALCMACFQDSPLRISI